MFDNFFVYVVQDEVKVFFDVYEQEGIYVGGVYFEMIGQNVIECVGGGCIVIFEDLSFCYYIYCDFRLNVL